MEQSKLGALNNIILRMNMQMYVYYAKTYRSTLEQGLNCTVLYVDFSQQTFFLLYRSLSVGKSFFFLSFFFFFVFFRAAPMAYGSCQARGQIRAAAASLYRSATWDLNCVCDLHHNSQQCQILNPLSEARDWTHILMNTSQVHYCWAMTGTTVEKFFPLEITTHGIKRTRIWVLILPKLFQLSALRWVTYQFL